MRSQRTNLWLALALLLSMTTACKQATHTTDVHTQDIIVTPHDTLAVADTIKVDEQKVPLMDEAAPVELREKKFTAPANKQEYYINGTSKAYMQYNYAAPPAGYLTQTQDFNTEDYSRIYDNAFKEARTTPLSTFSIDVDAASYSNVRRFINSGSLPLEDAVRIEEMVNYFDYDYPQPTGEHPFSITTEVAACPWAEDHKLIHIGLQGKKMEMKSLPPANLVFLLDVSGSMDEPNKLPLVKKSMTLLINQLGEKDKIAIVVYAGAAGVVLPPTSCDKKETILAALEGLQAGGSTAGGEGIQLAYKLAKENFNKEGNNRVILATDGDFNVGVSSDGELTRLIEEKRQDGIFLSVLGFGTGNYKDNKMEGLADKGNGNYAYIDNIMEAKKVFVNEVGATLLTLAKDVKIQVEFNPAKVQAYRLIGYENRLLQDQDFNDDTKDAGELGAGHTVTALYEIIPVGVKSNVPGIDPLKYQQTEVNPKVSASKELLTVKFRYKEPDGTESKLIVKTLNDNDAKWQNASDNFRFSASVAEWGMLLRKSEFKGGSSYKQVLDMAKAGKGKDEQGYRAEFIRMVETAELLSKPGSGGSSLRFEK